MIDEYWTWIFYGYHSDELSYGSGKFIVARCDGCCKYRILRMYKYSDLCRACSSRRENLSDETRFRLSESSRRENLSDETCKMLSESSRKENLSDETRKKLSDSHRAENLLDSTRAKLSKASSGKNNPMYGKMGKDSPNWKGGECRWRQLLYGTMAYKTWRKSVFERDDYTCQMCHVRGEYIEAHHIIPVKDCKNTLLVLDVSNGITLCKKCHSSVNRKEYDFVERFKENIGYRESL